jgi:hypothetical protein
MVLRPAKHQIPNCVMRSWINRSRCREGETRGNGAYLFRDLCKR